MLEQGIAKVITTKNTLKDIINAQMKGLMGFNLTGLQPATENRCQEQGTVIFQRTQPEFSLKPDKQASLPVKRAEWQQNTYRDVLRNFEPPVFED